MEADIQTFKARSSPAERASARRAELARTYIPCSTYRLQLGPELGFRDAGRLADYFRELGAGAMYFSPYFKASPGGNAYAVADPTVLSPELGGARGFEFLCGRLAAAGLGHIADVVPNHMGVAGNPYWWDILEHGQASPYADYFDIDWDPPKTELRGKVLLPVLEDFFGKVLEAGLIRLIRENGTFLIAYREHRFPAAPQSATFLASHPLAAFNGLPGEPASFDLLERFLALQHYRLAHWRAASDEINYRRFCNFNDLAAVRAEDPRAFELGHGLILRLIAEGKVQGLRVDHPDGLYDPAGYFARLPAALFVVVEKILDRRESLPEDWHVTGTVGYDFLNSLNGLFIDRDNEKAVDAAYESFIGRRKNIPELVYTAKRQFLETYLTGEIEALGHRLDALSETDRRYRDFTRRSLTAAIREVIACMPVYRTYVSPRERTPSETDRRYIGIALARARHAAPSLGPGVFDFLEDVLLLRIEASVPPDRQRRYRDFVLRFQQLTAPVMARGIEDTLFYIDHRLISLNEVGGSPARFGESASDFHRLNAERAERWPGSFAAASTHDTKRSEDARLRLDALSELPEDWKSAAGCWAVLNQRHKTLLGQILEPDPDTEYFIYQTLLCAWPDREEAEHESFVARVRAYIKKSVREAKRRTDWFHPDSDYEQAVDRFLVRIMERSSENAFSIAFAPFQKRISALGKLSALSALTLRLGSPGPVDVYQGDELWNYRLTDPDNRSPVDFESRRAALAELRRRLGNDRARAKAVRELVDARDEGLIKMFVLREGLRLRRLMPDLFLRGSYAGLTPYGPRADQLVGFLREHEGRILLAAGARFFSRLPEGASAWRGTGLTLPKSRRALCLRDAYTHRRISAEGGRVSAEELFGVLGAALLTGEHES